MTIALAPVFEELHNYFNACTPDKPAKWKEVQDTITKAVEKQQTNGDGKHQTFFDQLMEALECRVLPLDSAPDDIQISFYRKAMLEARQLADAYRKQAEQAFGKEWWQTAIDATPREQRTGPNVVAAGITALRKAADPSLDGKVNEGFPQSLKTAELNELKSHREHVESISNYLLGELVAEELVPSGNIYKINPYTSIATLVGHLKRKVTDLQQRVSQAERESAEKDQQLREIAGIIGGEDGSSDVE